MLDTDYKPSAIGP